LERKWAIEKQINKNCYIQIEEDTQLKGIKKVLPMAQGLSEIKILKSMDSSHVPKLLNFEIENDKMLIYMTFMEGVTLDSESIRAKLLMNRDLISYVFLQAILGLRSIHQFGIIHRDICPKHLLVTERLSVNFIDFGNSTDLSPIEDVVGTFDFAAPEVIFSPTEVNYSSDIYALCRSFFSLFEKNIKLIDSALLNIWAHAMSINIDKRYKCCDEVIEDLKLKCFH